jgi:hypothetical protein
VAPPAKAVKEMIAPVVKPKTKPFFAVSTAAPDAKHAKVSAAAPASKPPQAVSAVASVLDVLLDGKRDEDSVEMYARLNEAMSAIGGEEDFMASMESRLDTLIVSVREPCTLARMNVSVLFMPGLFQHPGICS